jgi:hypothetical protein
MMISHILHDVKENGCMRNEATSEGEFKHPEVKVAMKAGSMKISDQASAVLERTYWKALFEDVEALSSDVEILSKLDRKYHVQSTVIINELKV